MKIDTEKLIDIRQLQTQVFAEGCRPTIRTLRNWTKRRVIPSFQIGRLRRYDVSLVRESLNKKNLVKSL